MERIHSIDVVRGIALLGLLPMNILGFALPIAAYVNPSAYQGDWWFTYLSHFIVRVLFDQKMMALFSLLFGCSVALIASRNRAKERKAGRLHYLRNFWLLIFGCLHAILIWEGDILLVYAAAAFLIYPFYFLPARILAILGVVLWCTALWLTFSFAEPLSILVAGATENVSFWSPDEAAVATESARYLSSYFVLVEARLNESLLYSDTVSKGVLDWFVTDALLRAFALILVGLALAKSKFWYQTISKKQMILAKGALVLGWTLAAIGFLISHLNQWQIASSLVVGAGLNEIATPLCAAGYLIIIKRWVEFHNHLWIKDLFAKCGKMALTNYIAQSLLMSTLFYGYGLALYGSLNRLELWGVVILTWILLLTFSMIWMRQFKHGPLEFIWRKLSFSK